MEPSRDPRNCGAYFKTQPRGLIPHVYSPVKTVNYLTMRRYMPFTYLTKYYKGYCEAQIIPTKVVVYEDYLRPDKHILRSLILSS